MSLFRGGVINEKVDELAGRKQEIQKRYYILLQAIQRISGGSGKGSSKK